MALRDVNCKRTESSSRTSTNSIRKRTRKLNLERLEQRKVLTGWVESMGGSQGEWMSNDAQSIDPAGNVYLSGQFSSQPADFDPGSATTPFMSNAGETDAFVAKYDANGSLAWARRFGGAGQDLIESSRFSSEATGEYLYVTGTFNGSVDFGAGTLTSAGGTDVFVAKLRATDGSTVFAKSFGSISGIEFVSDLAVDRGQLYVSGSFNRTIDFDPGEGTTLLTPAGKGKNLSSDIYVLTLNSDGNYVSARQFGGTGADNGSSLIAEGNSRYVLGSVTGTVDLDPGPSIKNATGNFIAKLSTSPSPDWVKSVGAGVALGSDADSLYLLGQFSGTVDFNPSVGVANLTSVGSADAVVAKYAKLDGSYVWAKSFGGSGLEATGSVFVDGGMVYIGGYFISSTIDFNPSGSGGEMTSRGLSDAFLLKLDASTGVYQQAWQIGGTGNDRARPLGIVGTSISVAGSFEFTATFPTGGTLTSAGSQDIYLMSLDDAPAAPAPLTSRSTLESNSGESAFLAILAELDNSTTFKRRKSG